MSEFTNLLRAGLNSVGFHPSLTEIQLQQLEEHHHLLETWNRKINLTSIRTLDESVRRHYLECLYFTSLLERFAGREGSRSALDAGSGAGFPGIPMAILLPQWEISLIESDRRKAVFLREATRALPNTKVISERLEQVQKPAEWLVSRAVRPEAVLAQVPRLASRVGLLLGPEGWAEVQRDARFHWLPPVTLPSGDKMCAVFGSHAG